MNLTIPSRPFTPGFRRADVAQVIDATARGGDLVLTLLGVAVRDPQDTATAFEAKRLRAVAETYAALSLHVGFAALGQPYLTDTAWRDGLRMLQQLIVTGVRVHGWDNPNDAAIAVKACPGSRVFGWHVLVDARALQAWQS